MPNLNKSEFGQVVRVNMLEDISTATDLKLSLEPRLGTKLEKTASNGVVVGTIDIVEDDETYLANQYLAYTIKEGDLDYIGQWRIKGEVTFGASTGRGVQQHADPNFLLINTTTTGTGSDWAWTSSLWEITTNALRTSTFAAIVKSNVIFQGGISYRFEYTIEDNDLSTMFISGISETINLPVTVGSQDVTALVPVTPGPLTIQATSSAPAFTQFKITPVVPAGNVISDYKRIEVLA